MDKLHLQKIALEIRKGALTAVYTAASGHPLHPLQISIHINDRILLFLDTGAYFDRSL